MALAVAYTDTLIFGVIIGGKLGYFAVIPGDIITYVPWEILGLYRHCIDVELYTLVLHFAYVGGDLIGKVRSGRSIYGIQQVFGVLLVVFNATVDAVVEESVVDGKVVGDSLFPFQVGTVAVRFQ